MVILVSRPVTMVNKGILKSIELEVMNDFRMIDVTTPMM